MKSFLPFLMLALPNFCISQSWDTIANFPIPSIENNSFFIDGVPYVGTFDTLNDDVFYKYDNTQNVWQKIASPAMGELNGRRGGTTFTLNGKAYLLGGEREIDVQSRLDVWCYDPSSDSWSRKNDFPENEFFLADLSSFVINDTAYIKLGGINSFYAYNATNDSWSLRAPFPGDATMDHVAFSLNGKGYIGLGAGTLGNTDTFYSYDPELNAWSLATIFPGGNRASAIAFVINNIAYVGLGIDGFTYPNDLYAYDASTENWTKLDSTPYRAQDAVAVAGENEAYIGTGNFEFVIYNQFWKFDPQSTSTISSKKEDIILISPNPVKDVLHYELTKSYKCQQVDLYNTSGIHVFSTKKSGRISLANLPSGVYIMTVKTDKGLFTKKFVKE